MSEIDRLYSYRSILSTKWAVPREVILAKLEISLATFKRDLAKLRDRLNVPVIFDADAGATAWAFAGPNGSPVFAGTFSEIHIEKL